MLSFLGEFEPQKICIYTQNENKLFENDLLHIYLMQ